MDGRESARGTKKRRGKGRRFNSSSPLKVCVVFLGFKTFLESGGEKKERADVKKSFFVGRFIWNLKRISNHWHLLGKGVARDF